MSILRVSFQKAPVSKLNNLLSTCSNVPETFEDIQTKLVQKLECLPNDTNSSKNFLQIITQWNITLLAYQFNPKMAEKPTDDGWATIQSAYTQFLKSNELTNSPIISEIKSLWSNYATHVAGILQKSKHNQQ